MQMITLTEEQRQKANAKAVRERLFGKPQKPKPLLISVERPKRPDMDQSYHMVLYRKYLLRLEKAQQTVGNKVIYANFSVRPSVEYKLPAQVLEVSYPELNPIRRTMMQIAMEVLERYPDISLEEIRSRRRTHAVVKPKHEAIYKIYKERTDLSLPAIARFFGVDHTSILHCVRKMQYTIDGSEEGKLWLSRRYVPKAQRGG